MSYVYYPGCQYSAISPDNSEKIKDYLYKRFHMKAPGCCRKNYEMLTQKDTAVCVCPTCLSNLKKSAPHAEVISVWEILAYDDAFPWPDYQNKAITIQDCKDTQTNRKLQDAIRKILTHMNIHVIEIAQAFAKADFCRPRTDREIASVKKHCMEMTTDTVIGYCTGCVKGLQIGGKQGVHLMDIIMGNIHNEW